MPMTRRSALLGAAALLSTPALAARAATELPDIRIGVLENGTVNWEVQTIIRRGFDRANGFRLSPLLLAGNPATQVAMLGGEVDTIVSDWFWIAQQRQHGRDLTFLPYSSAVGGLMVKGDSPVQTLADLRDKRIGIAGGPVDKSWLILRAWSRKTLGQDIADLTGQVFGAPPMIMNAAETGEIDAAVNFWHFQARMQARGMRELISVETAAAELGLNPATPLLGYALRMGWTRSKPTLATGLARASRMAKDLLAHDDTAWADIRPLMGAGSDAEFETLRASWRAGLPTPGPVDVDSARRMFTTMADLGGEELTQGIGTLPTDLFWTPE